MNGAKLRVLWDDQLPRTRLAHGISNLLRAKDALGAGGKLDFHCAGQAVVHDVPVLRAGQGALRQELEDDRYGTRSAVMAVI